jgi:hypothetical protein
LGRAEYLLLKILINLCSFNLSNWLFEQKVYFCLRLKKEAFIEKKPEIWQQLKDLRLASGTSEPLCFIKELNIQS